MKSARIDRFLGMNTRLPDFSLVVRDVGRYLAGAKNVVFNKDGSVEARPSIEQIAAFTGAHSLYENMFVRGGALYTFTVAPGGYAERFVKLLSTNERMSYAKCGGMVFMSNGVDRLRRTAAGEFVPWALEAPAAPTATAVSGGMPRADYQIMLAYANQDEEGCMSPATLVSNVGVLSGGLLIDTPPGVPGATHVNVYVSGVNGNVPMFYRSVPIGETKCEVTELPTGREASRQIEAPLPAGTSIFEYNGRMFSVLGDTLYVGLPYRHGYYLPAEGFIRFTEDIQLAIGNQAGIYVATSERTVFIIGADPTKAENIVDAQPYGAVPGTEFNHPTDPNVGWFSAKGFVIGDNTGQIKELMTQTIADVGHGGGASTVITTELYDGAKTYSVVGCGWIVNLDSGAASRYEDASGVFNSASGGKVMTASGLCDLAGTSYAPAMIDIGNEDFDSEHEKHMPAVYVGAKSDAPLTLTVKLTNGTSYDYPARSFSETLGVHRVSPGKGLRDNWFGLSLNNGEGGKFFIASMSFGDIATKRKV